MRTGLYVLIAIALIVSLVFLASGHTSEPKSPAADPWVGTYHKYTHVSERTEVSRQITITKEGDVYRLGKPYDAYAFAEVEKGVLSDAKDGRLGLGKIFFGTAEFADGQRFKILRAEFCYEHFILYGERSEPAEKATEKAK